MLYDSPEVSGKYLNEEVVSLLIYQIIEFGIYDNLEESLKFLHMLFNSLSTSRIFKTLSYDERITLTESIVCYREDCQQRCRENIIAKQVDDNEMTSLIATHMERIDKIFQNGI